MPQCSSSKLGMQKLLQSGPKNLVYRHPQLKKPEPQTRHRYHHIFHACVAEFKEI